MTAPSATAASDGAPAPFLGKVVSGGQTGVDRAALDAALALGLPCGGWVPRGRRAEDGPIDALYPLTETESTSYDDRTELNIADSGATLLVVRGTPTGGTLLTLKTAKRTQKPYLIADLGRSKSPLAALRWLEARRPAVLNVAGPRESTAPGIYADARTFLQHLFQLALGR